MDVIAYATSAPKAPLEPFMFSQREVGPHDILIDIKFAGICHSDIHQAARTGDRPFSRWCPGMKSQVW